MNLSKRFPFALALGTACSIWLPLTVSAQNTPVNSSTQLTLSSAISAALNSNPISLAANAQLKESEAVLDEARAQQHFQLTFNSVSGVSNANVIQPPPSRETFGATQNSITVPLPVGTRYSLLVEQAKAQLAAAKATHLSSQLSLSLKVSAAYYDLLRKEALVAAAQADVETSRRELGDAQLRNNAGDIPQLDVLQAQVPVAADGSALLQAQSAESIAIETLNDLLSQPLDQPLSLQDVAGPVSAPPYSLEEARRLAIEASPDIAAAVGLVRSDQAALDAARRYADPALSLQAIDIRSKDATSFSREDTLQASVTVPIEDGGLGRATVKAASAALDQANLAAATVQKLTVTTVSADYLTVESSLAEVAAAQAAQAIAQSTYDKTKLGYAAGLYPLVDAITAENEVAQTRTAAIQALYDAESARTALDLNVGNKLTDSSGKNSDH